jgi:hypothetical protein
MDSGFHFLIEKITRSAVIWCIDFAMYYILLQGVLRRRNLDPCQSIFCFL